MVGSSGGSNEVVIFSFLQSKGLSPAQIAGVMGNLQVESGFRPTASNPREGAIGIAQWEGPRRTSLQRYASAHGGGETNLTIQLGFMWQELSGPLASVRHDLLNAHDPATVATIWDSSYERSDGTTRSARIDDARRIHQAIQNGSLKSKGTGPHPQSSRQRLVVHPSELAEVATQVATEADNTQYIVRGMTRHVAALDALVAGGQWVAADPARFELARRGLHEALTGKSGAQTAATGLSDVSDWVQRFRTQILAADGPASGLRKGSRPIAKSASSGGIRDTPLRTAASRRSARIKRMLALAGKQHANDGGNNHTKYGRWFGTDGVEWCAQFVSWVFAHSGNRLPSLDGSKGKGFQYCPDAINYARAHHQLHSSPKVGDIFLYKNGNHTGIVSKVYPDGHFDTIEGNAGPGDATVAHGVRNVNGDPHKGGYYFWTAIH